MTRIYFVRHGEATGNATGHFQGVTDNPLTEKGILQGQILCRRFANVAYDTIYTSPLCRAVETARLLDGDRGTPIVIDADFIEINGGDMEGTPMAELPVRFAEALHIWNNEMHRFVAPGLQDGGAKAARERLLGGVRKVVAAHPDETVVIVAHGFMLRVFNAFVQGIPFEEIDALGWGANTCVTCADIEPDGTPHPVFINDASHLPNEMHTPDSWKK